LIRIQRLILAGLLAGILAPAGRAQGAPIGDTFTLLEGRFAVRQVRARGVMLNDVRDARRLLRGDIPCAGTAACGRFDAINFLDPENGQGGHFDGGVPFPGDTAGDDHAFAVRVRGRISIPEPGVYTFGVNSDDGFRLRVGPLFLEHHHPRITEDSLIAVNFPRAGRYTLKLTYFEQGNGAELELFAARGAYDTFEAGSSPTVGSGTPPGVGAGPGVGSGPGTGSPAVPEPASFIAPATFAAALLLKRRSPGTRKRGRGRRASAAPSSPR
jgi:hypothetical protein